MSNLVNRDAPFPTDVPGVVARGQMQDDKTVLHVAIQFNLHGCPRDPRALRKNLENAAADVAKAILMEGMARIAKHTAATPEDPSPPWMKMERAVVEPVRAAQLAEQTGVPLERILAEETWMNDRYTASVKRLADSDGRPPMAHLSVRRNDRRAVNDWRDLQRIKNDIIGPECEAAQLFPAESRLVDSANQFHLWCLIDPKQQFPFGYAERDVSEASLGGMSAQRPWHPDDKPTDLNTDQKTLARYTAPEQRFDRPGTDESHPDPAVAE